MLLLHILALREETRRAPALPVPSMAGREVGLVRDKDAALSWHNKSEIEKGYLLNMFSFIL